LLHTLAVERPRLAHVVLQVADGLGLLPTRTDVRGPHGRSPGGETLAQEGLDRLILRPEVLEGLGLRVHARVLARVLTPQDRPERRADEARLAKGTARRLIIERATRAPLASGGVARPASVGAIAHRAAPCPCSRDRGGRTSRRAGRSSARRAGCGGAGATRPPSR